MAKRIYVTLAQVKAAQMIVERAKHSGAKVEDAILKIADAVREGRVPYVITEE